MKTFVLCSSVTLLFSVGGCLVVGCGSNEPAPSTTVAAQSSTTLSPPASVATTSPSTSTPPAPATVETGTPTSSDGASPTSAGSAPVSDGTSASASSHSDVEPTLVATEPTSSAESRASAPEPSTSDEVTSTAVEPSGEIPAVYAEEHTGADCPVPELPAYADLPSIDELPNPFQMADGSIISTKAQWRCRRAEINARIQKYELGSKPPPPPPSQLEATLAGNKLTVVVTDGGASITLSSTINLPSGAGPFPAIIGVGNGTGSLPANVFTSRNVATITFSETQLTPQQPGRGEGAFYKLYPDAKVGSYAAWAWGVSRIIDGLEQTAAENKIDLSHLGVTGCSYAGKLALYAGAFDERIALTIPQESGGGGEAAWRVSQILPGKVESLSNAQGTSWYYQDLKQFNSTPEKLPFDQHELAAMVAPRALLAIGNSGIEYLATEAGYVSLRAASEVWQALGVPERMGFSHSGNHGHCAFPDSQLPELTAFVERFLLGRVDVETNVAISPYDTDLTRWVPWATPELR